MSSKLCQDRVVIITGSGRGIGRAHALEFARQGAKVVVNDLGAEADGQGNSAGPAGEVVKEIRAMGGEAVLQGGLRIETSLDLAQQRAAVRALRKGLDDFHDEKKK